MNQKELRIGNIVKLDNSDRWNEESKGATQAVTGESFALSSIGGYDYDHFEPIPLTPEILEKCGFEKGGDALFDQYIKVDEDLSIEWSEKEKGCFVYSWHSTGANIIGANIKYLHHLQNVFFTLTQTELTVNI